MCQLEASLKVQSFFMMDENFLLDRLRALRLLELMEQHEKAWALYVFSSASALAPTHRATRAAGGDLGLAGPGRRRQPLREAPRHRHAGPGPPLQAHGTRVLGSTIIGLENHTPENIDAAIEHAVQRRHRLPPVHALHAASGHPAACRALGPGRIGRNREPACRRSWPVGLQLPPSPHPRRPGDGADPAGLSAGLRGQRPERGADGADHVGGLEAAQEPSRIRASAAASPGRPGTCPPSTRPWSPRRGSTTGAIRRCGRRSTRFSAGCTASSA